MQAPHNLGNLPTILETSPRDQDASPREALGGGAVSCERGTPVASDASPFDHQSRASPRGAEGTSEITGVPSAQPDAPACGAGEEGAVSHERGTPVEGGAVSYERGTPVEGVAVSYERGTPVGSALPAWSVTM